MKSFFGKIGPAISGFFGGLVTGIRNRATEILLALGVIVVVAVLVGIMWLGGFSLLVGIVLTAAIIIGYAVFRRNASGATLTKIKEWEKKFRNGLAILALVGFVLVALWSLGSKGFLWDGKTGWLILGLVMLALGLGFSRRTKTVALFGAGIGLGIVLLLPPLNPSAQTAPTTPSIQTASDREAGAQAQREGFYNGYAVVETSCTAAQFRGITQADVTAGVVNGVCTMRANMQGKSLIAIYTDHAQNFRFEGSWIVIEVNPAYNGKMQVRVYFHVRGAGPKIGDLPSTRPYYSDNA